MQGPTINRVGRSVVVDTGKPVHLLQSKTWKELRLLFSILPARRVRSLWFVLLLSLIQGVVDMLLVGLLARFVGIISGAKLNDQIPGIWIFGGRFLDQASWIIALLIAAYWFASALRFASVYKQSLLAAEIWSDVVNKVYANILMQDYEFFTLKSTSELSARFNRVLGRMSTTILAPLIVTVGNALTLLVLLAGVLIVLGLKALLIFALILLAYFVSSKLIVPYLRLASRQRVRFGRRINLTFLESIQSARDIHLYSSYQYFIDRFSRDGITAKQFEMQSRLLPDVPRFVIEPMAITILFAVGLGPAILAEGTGQDLRDSLPELATMMVVLLRMSAPLQNVFRDLNKLRGSLPEIQDAMELLQMKPGRVLLGSVGVPTPDGIMPRRFIELKDVGFAYKASDQEVLKSVNLTVPVGARIALVGKTGSGKTTLAHILLGLLSPTKGEIVLDGVPVSKEEVPAWQANCAFVPQDIRILNASVRDNVAFCQGQDEVNDDEVWAALAAAQFDDFVGQMPYGLYTYCGDNGVRLSGGQRQRLALARAFYRGAKFLVLDEATSALDNKTEHDVMQMLDIVGRRCTIVVIAHRLSTVRKCDQIYELANGLIVSSGNFDQLTNQSVSFREMSQLEESGFSDG